MSKSRVLGTSVSSSVEWVQIQPVLPSLTTLQGCCKVHIPTDGKCEWYRAAHIPGTAEMPLSSTLERKSLPSSSMEGSVLHGAPPPPLLFLPSLSLSPFLPREGPEPTGARTHTARPRGWT